MSTSMHTLLQDTINDMTAPGQMFELTEVQVAGQSLKAWAIASGSLREVWLNSAGYGAADYLVYEDERCTYTQAHAQVASVANWLVANGIGQHDRVAIAMRNYPEWMLAYWAIVCIGAVPVGINAWWVADELEHGLKDSAAKLLICDQERLQRFGEISDSFTDLAVVTVRVDDVPARATPWHSLLAADSTLPDVTIDPEDDASIFYTSGTTGTPKGARLSHRGCVNNLFSLIFMNMAYAAAEAKFTGVAAANPLAPDAPQMATMVATPLFHVTANNCVVQSLTMAGGKVVHMYKWDAGEALRIIEEEQITTFGGVPTMLRELVKHPDFATRDLSTLTRLGGGGAAVQSDLIEKINSFGNGVAPAQGYGQTETCGAVSASSGIFLTDKPDSAGRLMPIYEVKCVDPFGQELPQGETGELCLRGAQVMTGYLNRPEATAEAIVDGWLHTGDIGYMDADTFVYLVDRAKDMVLRGGENVYCAEVEAVLYRHDDVIECAVFAVPDERLGEQVGAAVCLAAGTHISAAELRAFCETKIAAYKAPSYIWILNDPLPRNASGKFVKRQLQQDLNLADAHKVGRH